MAMEVIHIDLFAGVGGFSLGLKMAGVEIFRHFFF